MRRESASSTTYSEMSESVDKRRKSYIYHPKNRSKLNFLIHGPGKSSDECTVLVDFGFKYSKSRPTKNRWHEPAAKKKFIRKQENNAIVQHEVDDIILQDDKELSAEMKHTRTLIMKSMKMIYMILIIWVLMKRKNNLSACLKKNQNIYDIKIQNGMTCIHVNEVNKISK